MKIEIEHGIPLPDRRRDSKYPWLSMKPGDSFFVPDATVKNFSLTWARRTFKPWKFVAKSGVKNGKNGIRVWRTE